MIFREATVSDIEALHVIRMAVKENALNTPSLVTREDYIANLTTDGKGWLCEIENQSVGFAIISFKKKNIWALFVHPDFERRGIAKQLQLIMLDWYFEKEDATLWLTTAPGTRAEKFYKASGWQERGKEKNGELRFEISKADWMTNRVD